MCINDINSNFRGSGADLIGSNYARMPVEREALRYNMSHKNRGHCVIFNHRHFDSHTSLGVCLTLSNYFGIIMLW